jgi:hypothetical protein
VLCCNVLYSRDEQKSVEGVEVKALSAEVRSNGRFGSPDCLRGNRGGNRVRIFS